MVCAPSASRAARRSNSSGLAAPSFRSRPQQAVLAEVAHVAHEVISHV